MKWFGWLRGWGGQQLGSVSIASFLFLLVTSQSSVAQVLMCEHFGTDVIGSGDWIATDGSAFIDITNGWLQITPDGGYADGADKFINLNLPIIIEARMRLVSGGQNYTLPAFGVFYGPTDDESDYITYLPNTQAGEANGWKFMDEWTDVHTMGPQSEGQWLSVRAIIREDGGSLYARADTDPAFTLIVTKSWSIPAQIERLAVRQHWDADCQIDYMCVSEFICHDRLGDYNCDGFEDAVDLALLIDRVFFGGDPATPCTVAPLGP